MVKTPIKKIMTKEVITAKRSSSIKSVIKLLSENKISGIPVLDENETVVGMICESDILSALKTEFTTISLVFPSSHALGMTFEETTNEVEIKDALKKLGQMKIEKIMTTELVTVKPENTIEEVAQIMVKNNINRVPVIENNKLVGIVTRGDIIRGLSKIR